MTSSAKYSAVKIDKSIQTTNQSEILGTVIALGKNNVVIRDDSGANHVVEVNKNKGIELEDKMTFREGAIAFHERLTSENKTTYGKRTGCARAPANS